MGPRALFFFFFFWSFSMLLLLHEGNINVKIKHDQGRHVAGFEYDMLREWCGGALRGSWGCISMPKTLCIMRLPCINSVQIPGYRGEG